jgi:hypothetical protein
VGIVGSNLYYIAPNRLDICSAYTAFRLLKEAIHTQKGVSYLNNDNYIDYKNVRDKLYR